MGILPMSRRAILALHMGVFSRARCPCYCVPQRLG